MAWFYRVKKEEQAEDKPKPVLEFYPPEVRDILNGVWEDGRPAYFDKHLAKELAKQESDADK